MRILLTNDDGIHARGLKALERIALQLTEDVWVVAPETDQSGVSHSLSLHNPLRLTEYGEKRFSVRGTPTDCVIMAVDNLMQEKPGLILSGVNSGLNVADDVSYSGTVAGAIEGTLLGIRSIALSQAYGDGSAADFAMSEKFSPELIRKLIDLDVPKNTYFNVNFPKGSIDREVPVKFTKQGKKNWDALFVDERKDHRGMPYYWIAFRGSNSEMGKDTDLQALQQGCISVTPLRLDMTDHSVFNELVNLADS